MADEDVERRLSGLERKLDNGLFVRKETYEADQRAQEKTDLAQERRFADIGDAVDELKQNVKEGFAEIRREDTQKRLLVYGAVVAALASLVATIIMGGGVT